MGIVPYQGPQSWHVDKIMLDARSLPLPRQSTYVVGTYLCTYVWSGLMVMLDADPDADAECRSIDT